MAITHDVSADGAAAGAGSERQFQSLSVIAPVFNEQGNIAPLCGALTAVLDTIGLRYEIILVNDGSSDNSLAEMRAAVADFPHVTAIDLLRNFGQTAALMAGIDHASGDVIITIDGDLQNDPADIPRWSKAAKRASTSCPAGARTARTPASGAISRRAASPTASSAASPTWNSTTTAAR